MAEIRKEWKLPKNVRQIGDGGGDRKIYIEDYVVTYLHQVSRQKEDTHIILLGEVREEKLYPYIFIDGAIEAERYDMNEKQAESLEERIRKEFGERKKVGWYHCAKESPFVMDREITECFQKYFSGTDQVLMVLDPLEQELIPFLLEEEVVTEQPGYYIYYEKNLPMQAVLLRSKETVSGEITEQVKEDAIHKFRKVIKRKREKKEGEGKHGRLLYTAGGFLLMTVLALGVTMIYNYDRMKQVEKSLARLTTNIESQAEYVTDQAEPVMMHLEEEEIQNEKRGVLEEATEKSSESGFDLTETLDFAKGVESDTENTTQDETELSELDTEYTQTTGEPAETTSADLSAVGARTSYIVKVGDTLAGISEMYYGGTQKVEDICELNGITDENTILPGQKILLP